MKYHILLALTVEADPADLGGAAKKGFNALAKLLNSGKPVCLHLVPQDGGGEAQLTQTVLDTSFVATSTPCMK